MTQYEIHSKGQFNGKPVEVSANVKAPTVSDAIKSYLESTGKHNITLNSLTVRDHVEASKINA